MENTDSLKSIYQDTDQVCPSVDTNPFSRDAYFMISVGYLKKLNLAELIMIVLLKLVYCYRNKINVH